MSKYTEKFIIPCYNTDVACRLKPTAFMNIAQEAAGENAKHLGFGYDDLIKYNTAWILSRVHVVFIDTPKWKDEITLQTWHKGLDRLFYLRDFIMTDSEGRERVKATTSWLILDLETRKMVRHPQMDDEGTVCKENIIEKPADKVRMPRSAEPELVRTHEVSYSDIDNNGHTNNAMYMQWSMNAVGYEITSARPVKEFTINFNHETKIGDRVNIYRVMEEREDGLHVFVEGKVEDTSSYIVEIIF